MPASAGLQPPAVADDLAVVFYVTVTVCYTAAGGSAWHIPILTGTNGELWIVTTLHCLAAFPCGLD